MKMHKAVGGIVLSLALMAGLTTSRLQLPCSAAEEKPTRSDDKQLAAWWADLAGSDEGKIARATLSLAAQGKKAVPFLRERLRSVKVDQKKVAALLEKLDNDNFTERESAFRELEYLGKYIKSDLEKILKGKPSAEVKKRVERLLEPIIAESTPAAPPPKPVMRGNIGIRNVNGNVQVLINGKPIDLTPRIIEKRGPAPAWLRVVRAAAVLEHIGTPEAKQVLATLAAGESDALPTRAAAEALQRLKK